MVPIRYFLVAAGLALGVAAPFAVGCSSSSGSPTQEAPANDAGPTTDASGASDSTTSDAQDDFVGPGAPPPSMTSLPEAGVYMGAFVDIINGYDAGAATDTNSEDRFVAAEDLVGRRFVIDNRFYDDATEFVSDRTMWDIANNLVPMITWMPYGNGNPLVEIIQGEHDAYIHAEAQKAKALGVQILMRWGHEMNGNWYPWAGYINGEGGDADAGDGDGGVPSSGPAKYVAAWRHVHDIFVAEGATNVVWVWCTNSNDVPDAPWNHWTEYYPGDDYVDWVGIDAYNWGNSSSCCIWTTFAALLTGSPYQDYAAKKPIMLPETASAEVGGNKAAWIMAMHQNLTTEFRGIRAVVWFDINKETDWRIDSSPSSLAAYQAMALDPYFNP
jgi:beta-mannanase